MKAETEAKENSNDLVPKKYVVQIHKSIHQTFKIMSIQQGTKMSDCVNKALMEWLESKVLDNKFLVGADDEAGQSND